MGAVFPLCFYGTSSLCACLFCLCVQTSPFCKDTSQASGPRCDRLHLPRMFHVQSQDTFRDTGDEGFNLGIWGGHSSIHTKHPYGQTVMKTREVAGTCAAWPALPGWLLTRVSLCQARISVPFVCHSSSPSEQGAFSYPYFQMRK